MDGDRIRYFRHTQKLSPKELSKLTGISRISIGYYERGDRSPKMDNLKLIAKALDIDIMKLVDEKAYISANFIGLRIRAERECKGLTQEHLAEKQASLKKLWETTNVVLKVQLMMLSARFVKYLKCR